MTSEGNGWYSYTFQGASCANMIFSNNGSSKTADLSRCTEGWYYNNQWYDTNPDTIQTRLVIHFMKPASWSTAKMHYWSVTSSNGSTIPDTQWPVVQMINEGTDWWSYTIANGSCANIVFNNNGSP